MDRIKEVQKYIDTVILETREEASKKYGYMHLYGVSQFCAILAYKRKQNVELAAIAGLLHDISRIQNPNADDHAHNGAVIAQKILLSLEAYSEDEITMVCTAIYHHSDKETKDSPFDEVLKDADVLQHCLYEPMEQPSSKETGRFAAIKNELGL